jgi:hypothetical protein
MSQFVKSVKHSVVHVSSGSKSSAPYELACVKGVRNTSFVPAEGSAEKEKLLEKQRKIMKDRQEKDKLAIKKKKEEEAKKKEEEAKKKEEDAKKKETNDADENNRRWEGNYQK